MNTIMKVIMLVGFLIALKSYDVPLKIDTVTLGCYNQLKVLEVAPTMKFHRNYCEYAKLGLTKYSELPFLN